MSSSQANNAASAPSHNQLDTKAQAWSALFSEPMSDLVKRYTSSVFFDKRLWQADIAGSLAHAEMLAAQGVISAEDHASIQRGMAQITQEIESGAFEWKLDLEDVHLNIEARLTQLVGDAGKRLHTGRSRNAQVATDVRLWLRPVCRRLPASPTSWVRRASMFRCTSSRSSFHSKAPDSISSLICAMPRWMEAWSEAEMMPCAASISACARLPAMSACHRRLSKNTLEV